MKASLKPRTWIKLGCGFLLLMVLIIGVIIGAMEWRFRKSISDLKKAGEPLTMMELLGPVPEKERARAIEFSALLSRFDRGVYREGKPFLQVLNDLERDAYQNEIPLEAFRKEQHLLIQDSVWLDVFDGVEQIFQKGDIYFPIAGYGYDFEPDDPRVSRLWTLWMMGNKWVTYQVYLGNLEEAEGLVLRMLEWEKSIHTNPVVLDALIEVAGESMLLDAIRIVVASGGLNRKEHREVLWEWAKEKRGKDFGEIFRGERTYILEFELSRETVPFFGYEHSTTRPFLDADYWVDQKLYWRYMIPRVLEGLTQAGAWANLQPFERKETWETLVGEAPFFDVLSPMLLGGVNITRKTDVHYTRLDLLEVVLHLQAYHLKTGAYPESLSEMGVDLPVDRFSGKPLKYKKVGESYLLYSVGKDLTDEGGKTGDKWQLEGYDKWSIGEYDILWDHEVVFP